MSLALLTLALIGCSGTPIKVKSAPRTIDSEDPETTDTTDNTDTDTDSPSTETGGTGTIIIDTGPFFTVEPGTGETAFIPLDTDDWVEIIAGPQGGWHFLGAVRICNMAPPFSLHYQVTERPSGVVVVDQDYAQWMLIDEGNGCRHTYNIFGFIDVTDLVNGDLNTPPVLLPGHGIEVLFEVTDDLGRQQSGAVEAVAYWP